jgi:hypothetical protein
MQNPSAFSQSGAAGAATPPRADAGLLGLLLLARFFGVPVNGDQLGRKMGTFIISSELGRGVRG